MHYGVDALLQRATTQSECDAQRLYVLKKAFPARANYCSFYPITLKTCCLRQ